LLFWIQCESWDQKRVTVKFKPSATLGLLQLLPVSLLNSCVLSFVFPCLVSLQLESLRTRLDEREDLLKQKEKKLISVSSEHSENSYAVDNLQSLLVTKERQITSLRLKVIQKTYRISKSFAKVKLKLIALCVPEGAMGIESWVTDCPGVTALPKLEDWTNNVLLVLKSCLSIL